MGFLLVLNTKKSKKEVCKRGYSPNLAMQGSLAVYRGRKRGIGQEDDSVTAFLIGLFRASDPEANFFSLAILKNPSLHLVLLVSAFLCRWLALSFPFHYLTAFMGLLDKS